MCAFLFLGVAPLAQAQDEEAPEVGAPAAKAAPNLAIRREFFQRFRTAVQQDPEEGDLDEKTNSPHILGFVNLHVGIDLLYLQS